MRTGTKRREALVPINREVLQALLHERRWTVASLARRTGELEQTLAHILKNPHARCRKSRRAKIAKALQVPQELLAGESFPVPVGFMLPDGFEFRYSPRTQLAASRFITRARTALQRDLRTRSREKPASLAASLDVENAVLSVFSEFMMIGEWRQRFIKWVQPEQERRGYTEPATISPWEASVRVTGIDPKGFPVWEVSAPRSERDPDHEAAIVAVIRAMEHVFEPWFTGAARLNYRAMRDFTYLPSHPFARVIESIPAESPFAIFPPIIDKSENQRAGRKRNHAS